MRAVGGHGDGNRQLKVVARGREALGDGEAVAEAQAPGREQRGEEDEREVDDQRRGHAHDRHDLAHDLRALRGEQHEDGEEQADQGPGRHEADEVGLVALGTDEREQRQAGDDGSAEGDAEEDADRGGDGRVRDGDEAAAVGVEDADEEERERGEQDDLQQRVDGDENGTVVAVAAGLWRAVVSSGVVGAGKQEGLTRLFQIRTMAMQRAIPTRMRPSRRPCSSGRKAHARPSCVG